MEGLTLQYDSRFQQPYNSEVKPVKIEEILRLMTFLLLTMYSFCHILFIPIEFMIIVICQDPDLKTTMYAIIGVFAVKYASVVIMFYCAYHHSQLWNAHSHIELYLFGGFCFITTTIFFLAVFIASGVFHQIGIGSVFDHPFFYDFLGFIACGYPAIIYILYMACTKPAETKYFLVPSSIQAINSS